MMTFLQGILGAAIAMAVCGSACAGEPVQFTRNAHLSLDANGKVLAIAFTDAKPGFAKLDARLEPVIRQWAFAPGMVDGQPMPTETNLGIQLEATPDGHGEYAISLLDAWTGVGFIDAKPPEYPFRALELDCEGIVTLTMNIAASGSPTDIKVENNNSSCAKKDFELAAIAGAGHWRFAVEKVAGQPVMDSVRVPVEFCMSSRIHGPCNKRVKQSEAARQARAKQNVTIDSQAKLLTQVTGMQLRDAAAP
ncbi:MAG: TonB family protein [Proteobacteria bacterium]|nr:TonB family protein [Pseudomonadota bacterium]